MRYDWSELYSKLNNCNDCGLCRERKNVVIGMGNPEADIMFIGEGPGRDEDEQGLPFVGRAGQLLDKMLESIGLNRDNVYIANIVKCRPPQNRVPTDDEAEACIGYLRAQVALVSPKIIVCLGATAARHIIGHDARITRDRGTWYHRGNTDILLTYHPAALLRDETKKRPVWEDLKALKAKAEEMKVRPYASGI